MCIRKGTRRVNETQRRDEMERERERERLREGVTVQEIRGVWLVWQKKEGRRKDGLPGDECMVRYGVHTFIHTYRQQNVC